MTVLFNLITLHLCRWINSGCTAHAHLFSVSPLVPTFPSKAITQFLVILYWIFFLNPIHAITTGGDQNSGWFTGRGACVSGFISYLILVGHLD